MYSYFRTVRYGSSFFCARFMVPVLRAINRAVKAQLSQLKTHWQVDVCRARPASFPVVLVIKRHHVTRQAREKNSPRTPAKWRRSNHHCHMRLGVLRLRIASKRRKFSVVELNVGSMIKPMPKVMCYYAHSSPKIQGNEQSKPITCVLRLRNTFAWRRKMLKRIQRIERGRTRKAKKETLEIQKLFAWLKSSNLG